MCNLSKAREIIENDPNGEDLTDENYQEVLELIQSEISLVQTTLAKAS